MQNSDKFKEALLREEKNLKECQKEKGLKSCFNCDNLLDCPKRDAYIKAVYESMNKGETGGFEF